MQHGGFGILQLMTIGISNVTIKRAPWLLGLLAIVTASTTLANPSVVAERRTPVAGAAAVAAPVAEVSEIRAALFMTAPTRQAADLADVELVRGLARERLSLESWVAAETARQYSEDEKNYLAYQQLVNRVKAGLDIAERRSLQRLYEQPALVEQRAREIYLANPQQYTEPESASISVILLNSFTRGWRTASNLAVKASAQAKKVKTVAEFEALAKKLSDDAAIREGKRSPTFSAFRPQADPALRKVVFENMKVGEVSEPIATQAGLLVIRLNDRKPARLKPFEEVAVDLTEKVLKDFGNVARRDAFSAVQVGDNDIKWAPQYDTSNKTEDPALLDRLKAIGMKAVREGKTPDEAAQLMQAERERSKSAAKP